MRELGDLIQVDRGKFSCLTLPCPVFFFFFFPAPWRIQSFSCLSSLCDFGKKTLLSIRNRFRESEVNFSNDYGNQKLDLEAKEAKDRFCKVAGLLWVCFAPQSCCGRHELSCRQSSWNEMQCFQILYWLDFCFAVTFKMCQHCDPSMFRDREIRPLPCLQRGMVFISQTHYLRLLWDSCW